MLTSTASFHHSPVLTAIDDVWKEAAKRQKNPTNSDCRRRYQRCRWHNGKNHQQKSHYTLILIQNAPLCETKQKRARNPALSRDENIRRCLLSPLPTPLHLHLPSLTGILRQIVARTSRTWHTCRRCQATPTLCTRKAIETWHCAKARSTETGQARLRNGS